MRKHIDLNESDLVNLIHVASKAEKNKTALIKARYHMFVRALEGAFITLNQDKKLYLTRRNYAEIGGRRGRSLKRRYVMTAAGSALPERQYMTVWRRRQIVMMKN